MEQRTVSLFIGGRVPVVFVAGPLCDNSNGKLSNRK